MENSDQNLTPFWRKFSIIIPIIVVLITAIVSLITHFQFSKQNAKGIIEEHKEIIQEMVITEKKPLFFIRDFITYGSNKDLGSFYSDKLLELLFNLNKGQYKIIERQKISTEEIGEGLIPYCSMLGATHIIEGRVHQDANSISIRLFSCLSNGIIFTRSYDVNDVLEFSQDNLKPLPIILNLIIQVAIEDINNAINK